QETGDKRPTLQRLVSRVSRRCQSAAKASGTLQGFLVPQSVWLCSPRPACSHPSPGGFAGALAGGGAAGGPSLICRFSNRRWNVLTFERSNVDVSPTSRQGTSTSSAAACAAAHALDRLVVGYGTNLSRPWPFLVCSIA